MIEGRCECAKVRYQVEGELVDFCHCHCSVCRRLHGAAFVTWGGIKRDEFAFTSGADDVKKYAFSENADSVFCAHCGSRMLVDFKPEADMLYIAMGTVLREVECPPGFHQFTAFKAPWYEITDDLPQHLDWPGEE